MMETKDGFADKLRRAAENNARLMGVVAALGLPEVRGIDGVYRKRLIEIELAPGSDLWQLVDGLSISADRITFLTKPRAEWVFSHREGCPAWRMDHGRPRHGDLPR
jgi:hypothetical protein